MRLSFKLPSLNSSEVLIIILHGASVFLGVKMLFKYGHQS